MKSEIQSFLKIYAEKLAPIFKDIESEADSIANDYFTSVMSQPANDFEVDPGSVAERATDLGIQHYFYLSLGRYNLIASWHVTLYQFWEQQVRSFLFREISHIKTLQIETFCTNIKEIIEAFACHNINVHNFSAWSKIEELRLLCNVIKHGGGGTVKKLRKVNSTLFRIEPSILLKKGTNVDLLDAYKTTLLEETLNINQATLEQYGASLIAFWENIPERSYTDDL